MEPRQPQLHQQDNQEEEDIDQAKEAAELESHHTGDEVSHKSWFSGEE